MLEPGVRHSLAPVVMPDRAVGDAPAVSRRVRVDGKQFSLAGTRFRFRGVTYGTFAPREDGARFPQRERLKLDFAGMAEADFSVVRTYTAPTDDLLEVAADFGVRVLAGAYFPDWRYLVGASLRERRRIARAARDEVRRTSRHLAGQESVLGLCLANEIPADVVRWVGTKTVTALLGELVEVVREEDPDVLVTYANYPTAEYLTLDGLGLDFVTFNVYLERRAELRRYLTRLQHLAGDRPLVLGEIGLPAGDGDAGEQRQADFLDWQMETAIERGVAGTCVFAWTDEWVVGDTPVEGWPFGLTRADRSPRPALATAQGWNNRDVTDLAETWPSMSVVICAYNESATLDECLAATCALDYPGLEIIVVDDGSTDDTAAIARRHPVRLLEVPHAGLSVARNRGFRAATGEIVAYLDADAYPSPEWPYYLALAFDGATVGGAGGPNLPPLSDGVAAHAVAQAPGGPVHVLMSDDRAEHVPGCNMAFWRTLLEDIGGFDPIFTSAGDDVDLCWRVLDRGWDIGFHPAAVVWHHRRGSTRTYLRQQRGYGRAEALVGARHPDRFTALGSARWRGRIYGAAVPSFARRRVYRGPYGAAAYQSVYQGGGHLLDVAHQVGIPAAIGLVASAPLSLLDARYGVPAALGASLLAILAVIDLARALPPRTAPARWAFRARVALLHTLQPLVRSWGRVSHGSTARRSVPRPELLPGPAVRASRGVLVLPADRPRPVVAATLVAHLRDRGVRVHPSTGWEDRDVRLPAGPFVFIDVVTSSYPEGCIQVRTRRRLRWWPLATAGSVVAAVASWAPAGTEIVAAAVLFEVVRATWQGPRAVRAAVRGAVQP